MAGEVNVIDHPLVTHKLTIMRQKSTNTGDFRSLVQEVSMLLAYEVTRDSPMKSKSIETPLETTEAKVLDGNEIVFISILRAGNGILNGMLRILPSARVGHVGLYRDPKTHVAVEYYFKVPPGMAERAAIVVDPMMATANSAIAAIDRIKKTKPRSLKFVCLVAAPEGIQAFHEHHPDVPIYTAAIDRELNEHGYIVPGLGDAGDRLYGTQ